jgi:vancomycin resistance protein YoaR
MDATVFSPTHDLKFKNDTANYILIQAKTDIPNYTLVFEIYGTKDDRTVEITKPVILSQSPPPPDLYQDDPTLPKGTIKQVDWKAWGAKVTFNYKVTRNGENITEETFFSNFKPWQAVFLKGTKE